MSNELIKSIIYILVGISILIFGMKIMSNGMKKVVGKGIRNFFKKNQNNNGVSMLTGAAITAGIQSSDATNSMVIGFIDSGTVTIAQGLAIMLGAYIGTTSTGLIAAFSSFKLSVYLLLLTFIGVVFSFFKNEKIQNISEILIGLGLLFFGIAVMKDSLQHNQDILSVFGSLFSRTNFMLLLFLIGFAVTAIIQSSSAFISIIIALVGVGSEVPLISGVYLALGATLGTVLTTIIVSLNGQTNGKRAAISVFMLRFISSVLVLIILGIFGDKIVSLFEVFSIENSNELPLAMFVLVYNLIFMPLMLPLINPVVKISTKLIKDREEDKLSKTVHFINDKFINTPHVAAMQVKKEILNMYDLSCKNYQLSLDRLLRNVHDEDKNILENEDAIDYLNKKITDYLILLSTKIDSALEKSVGSYFHVVNDIERIGDHAYNFYEMSLQMEEKDLFFSEYALKEINEMNEIICKMFKMTRYIFNGKHEEKLDELHGLENVTDKFKSEFFTNHYERIKNGLCSNELTPFMSSLVTYLERVADHLTNVAYSILDPTGSDEK